MKIYMKWMRTGSKLDLSQLTFLGCGSLRKCLKNLACTAAKYRITERLQNEDFHNFYSSVNMARLIKRGEKKLSPYIDLAPKKEKRNTWKT
jgi:hypothetical protein